MVCDCRNESPPELPDPAAAATAAEAWCGIVAERPIIGDGAVFAIAVKGGGRMNGVDEFAEVVIAACDATAMGQS